MSTFQDQLGVIYSRLQSLSENTLLTIITELNLSVAEGSEYSEMTSSILSRAKAGYPLSSNQKRVLVNFIAKSY